MTTRTTAAGYSVAKDSHEDRYFKSFTLENHKCIILKAVQGVGKSFAIRNAVQGTSKILAITHRRSLAEKAAQDFNIANYRSRKLKLAQHQDSVAIVIDSLTKLTPAHFAGATVILDEFTQLFRHIIGNTVDANSGSTLGEHRTLGLIALRHILQEAAFIIAADADADAYDENTQWLLNLAGETQCKFITNTFKPTNRELNLEMSETHLRLKMDAFLEQRKLLAVACESREYSVTIEKHIRQQHPTLNVRLINSNHAEDKETRAFIADINNRINDVDVLIYSPSLFTGIDITTKHFDYVFLIAEYNLLPAGDLVQAVHRARELRNSPRQVFAYVSPKTEEHPVALAEVEAQLLERRKHLTEFIELDKDGHYNFPQNHDVVTYALASSSRVNASLNNRLDDFVERMKRQGYVISGQPGSRVTRSKARESHEERAERLNGVPTPEAHVFKRIQEKEDGWRNGYERSLFERYNYFVLNGSSEVELSELFRFPLERLKNAVNNIEALEKDALEDDDWTAAIREVEASYGGFKTERQLSGADFAPFVEAYLKHRKILGPKIRNVQGDVVEKPGNLFHDYLEKVFSMKNASTQLPGQAREYAHWIDDDSRQLVRRFVARRKGVTSPIMPALATV